MGGLDGSGDRDLGAFEDHELPWLLTIRRTEASSWVETQWNGSGRVVELVRSYWMSGSRSSAKVSVHLNR